MSWFYNLKIGKKLLCAFSLVIAFTCVMGLFSIVELVKVSKSSTDIATNWLPAVRYVGQVQTSLARYRISEASHILVDEGDEMTTIEKSMASRLETMRKQQEALAALVTDAEESRIYAELKQDVDAYLAQSTKLVALSRAGNKDEARVLFRGASNKIYRKLNEQFEALSKYNDEGSSGSGESRGRTFRHVAQADHWHAGRAGGDWRAAGALGGAHRGHAIEWSRGGGAACGGRRPDCRYPGQFAR